LYSAISAAPNNSFKPTPHRGVNSVLCATLHAVATPLRGGLTQALGRMNPDQQSNIENSIRAIGESLFNAWRYLQLLKGLQTGAKEAPDILLTHAIAIDVTYRAAFDALYAVVGTICDRTSGTLSIPNLINMARRYTQDPEVKRALTTAETALKDPKHAPLLKLSNWRHKHVAHRTEESRIADFYANNKLHLGEIEEAIDLLDRVANDISVALTHTHYDWRTAAESVASNCASLLTRNAA
jgi:AbiU2